MEDWLEVVEMEDWLEVAKMEDWLEVAKMEDQLEVAEMEDWLEVYVEGEVEENKKKTGHQQVCCWSHEVVQLNSRINFAIGSLATLGELVHFLMQIFYA